MSAPDGISSYKSRYLRQSVADCASSRGALLFVGFGGCESLAIAAVILLRGCVAPARVPFWAASALAVDAFDFWLGSSAFFVVPHAILIYTGSYGLAKTARTSAILGCFEGGPAFDRGASGARRRASGGIEA